MRFKAKLIEIALNYLETSEMLAITASWLGEGRPLLESLDKTKPFVGDVEKVHSTLIQVRPKEKVDARVAAIQAEQRLVDNLHDHALRALYYAHEALIEYLLAKEPVNTELVALLRQSQLRLMGGDLSGVKANYDVEAGTTERAAKIAQEEEDIQKALSAVAVTENVNGYKMLELWVAHGARLGELNRDKSDAIAKASSTATPEEREARENWIDVVLTMLKVLSRIEDPTDDIRDLHRRVIESAEKARKQEIDARRARQAANAQQPPAGEEKPPEK